MAHEKNKPAHFLVGLTWEPFGSMAHQEAPRQVARSILKRYHLNQWRITEIAVGNIAHEGM